MSAHRRLASKGRSMLQVDRISLTFGGIDALRDVSLTVAPRHRHGIIGPNGAGKTALLNCVSGVYRPGSGSVTLYDSALTGRSMEYVSLQGVARTFQSMDHFVEFRVADYVLLGRVTNLGSSSLLEAVRWPSYVRTERRERAVVADVLEMCGLAEHANAELSEIPYGTQKLVDIARVIASEAPYALLDEPTSGTTSSDRPAISAALDVLAERGTATVVVDHDVDFVVRHVDTVTALEQGAVIAEGATSAVMADDRVRRIYRGLVREDQLEHLET
jgi:branched-chain amino acid transport system ATP-binding protein